MEIWSFSGNTLTTGISALIEGVCLNNKNDSIERYCISSSNYFLLLQRQMVGKVKN